MANGLSYEEAMGLSPGPSPSPGVSPTGGISFEEAIGQAPPQPAAPAAPAPAPSQPATDQAMGRESTLLGFDQARTTTLGRGIPASLSMLSLAARAAISGIKPMARGAVAWTRGEDVVPTTTEPYGVTWPTEPPARMTAAQAMAEQNRILQHPALGWTQKTPEFATKAFPVPPGEEKRWYGQLGTAAGGFIPILASGPAAPLTIGAMTTGDIIEHTYAEKIKQGIDPERAARETFDKAIVGGATQAALWAVLPKPLKSVFDRYVIDTAKKAGVVGEEGFRRFVLNRFAQAAEGAVLGVGTQIPTNIVTGEPAVKDVGATAGGLALAQALFPRGGTHREIAAARTAFRAKEQQTREAVEEFLGRRKAAEEPVPPAETMVGETAKIPEKKAPVVAVANLDTRTGTKYVGEPGETHGQLMERTQGITDPDKATRGGDVTRGWVDKDGNFLTSEEAWERAKQNKQLQPGAEEFKPTDRPPQLDSIDIQTGRVKIPAEERPVAAPPVVPPEKVAPGEFKEKGYTAKETAAAEVAKRSPFFIEKHGDVYAVVDRRKPGDIVGTPKITLEEAQAQKTQLDTAFAEELAKAAAVGGMTEEEGRLTLAARAPAAEPGIARPLEPLTASKQRAIDSWREGLAAGDITQAQFDDAVARINRGEMPSLPGQRLEKPGEAELPVIEATRIEPTAETPQANEQRIAQLEGLERLAGPQGLPAPLKQDLEARKAARGLEGVTSATAVPGDTPAVTKAKADILAWQNTHPAGTRVPKRLTQTLQHAEDAAAKAREKTKINREVIEKLLSPEDLARHEELESQWARVDLEIGQAVKARDRNKEWQLAERQIEIRREQRAIESKLPDGDVLDVAVFGSGPTGNQFTISGATEGLRITVFETGPEYGGASKKTFYENVSGSTPGGEMGETRALADRFKAMRHGAQYERIIEIDGTPTYDPQKKIWTIKTLGSGPNGTGGKTIRARVIFGATGTRGKGAPFSIVDDAGRIITKSGMTGSPQDNSGVKVHLDNVQGVIADSKAAGNGPMILIGAANSGAQGAVLAAEQKNAGKIHLIFRGKVPSASDYLRNKVEELVKEGRIILHPNEQIISIEAPSPANGMKKVAITKNKAGKIIRTEGDAVGSFLGGTPNTEWLPGNILKDARGSVKSTGKLEAVQKGKRGYAEMAVEEPVPGLYVGGSMRAGEVSRMPPSLGEGTIAESHAAKHLLDQELAGNLPAWKVQLRERFNRQEYGVEPPEPSGRRPVAPRPTIEELRQRQDKAFDVFMALKGRPEQAAAWQEYLKASSELQREAGGVTETVAPPGTKIAPSRLIPSPPKPKEPKKTAAKKPFGHVGATLLTPAQQQPEGQLPPRRGRGGYPVNPFGPRRGQVFEPGTPEERKAAFDVVDQITYKPAREEMYLPEPAARAQAAPPAAPGMIAEPRPTNVRERLAKAPETLPTETLRDSISDARRTLEDYRVIAKKPGERGLAKELSTRIEGWQKIVDARETAVREDPALAEAEATRRVEANAHYPDKLVTDLKTGERVSVDAADEVVMTRDREKLQGQRDVAAQRANNEKLSKGERAEAGSNFEDLDAQLRLRDEATDGGNIFKSPRTRAQWHQFRARDYNLPNMEQKLRVAKGGKAVTKEESADLKNKVDTLATRMGAVEKEKLRTGWRPGMGKKADVGKLRHKQFKAYEAKNALDNTIFKEMLRHKNKAARAFQLYRDVAGVSRAIMTVDWTSALLRQGGMLFAAHPIRSLRIMRDVYRASKSDEGYFKLMQDIRERPNADLYVASKLGLTEIKSPKMQDLEEQYMSQWVDKIPVLAHSQRAYVYFLNRLRADTFDAMAHNLGRNYNVTLEQARGISNFINVFTGRGRVPEQAAGAIAYANELFFAPRYVISRFQALTGQPLWGKTGRAAGAEVRKMIAWEYARTLMGYGIFYGLASTALKQLGVSVEYNPLSTDFGKLRVGDTRFDVLSGLAQATVILSRGLTAHTKTRAGKIEKLYGEKAFTARQYFYVLADFVRQKFAPVPSAFINSMARERVTGEPTHIGWEALGLVTSMSGRDLVKALSDAGMPLAIISFLASNFGISANTYSVKVKTRKRKRHRTRERP